MVQRQCAVYIMTNHRNGTLYAGVTSTFSKRIWQHKQKIVEGFTKQYDLVKLVYYELFNDIREAIEAEKKIKSGSRKKKVEMIERMNPNWKDLSDVF